jgi:hypothetical protein
MELKRGEDGYTDKTKFSKYSFSNPYQKSFKNSKRVSLYTLHERK